jgi:hypothetical protein
MKTPFNREEEEELRKRGQDMQGFSLKSSLSHNGPINEQPKLVQTKFEYDLKVFKLNHYIRKKRIVCTKKKRVR